MPSDCNGVSCFQQISEKKTQNLPLKFGYFHVSVSSTTLTTFWLPIFVSAKPNRFILLIDRSEPKFESHTEGEKTKTLKNGANFDGFC